MDKTNQDVVGEKCVRNDAGELSLSDEEKMKAWVEHYARLLNVEFEWESNLLLEVAPVEGQPPVTTDLIPKALRKMKCGKAAGPSGIIAEMLKAAGEVGIELLTELTEVVFCNGVIPTDWWTLTPCSLALCRVVAPLMLSSSSANCKRSTALRTSHFTSPLLIWRRLSTEYPGKIFGGP